MGVTIVVSSLNNSQKYVDNNNYVVKDNGGNIYATLSRKQWFQKTKWAILCYFLHCLHWMTFIWGDITWIIIYDSHILLLFEVVFKQDK